MARSFDGSNDGLTFAGAPTTSTTMTLGGWFWFNSGLASTNVFTLGTNGSANNRRYIRYQTSDGNFAAVSINNAGTAVASSSSASGLFDQWVHVLGVWTGTTKRQVFVNGIGATANTATNAPNNPDQLRVGIGHTGTGPLAGRAAELAIWDGALDTDEIAAYARGLSPLAIRPASQIGYWDLVRGVNDIVGGNALTLVDAPAVADHPRVYYLRGRSMVTFAGPPNARSVVVEQAVHRGLTY